MDGYDTVIDGFTVTNFHVPEKTEVTVVKHWVGDEEAAEEKRPVSITVHLYADGVEIASAVLTEADGWTHTFTDLDKFADGKEIVYTVTEDPVPEYVTQIDGYIITNVYNPDTGDALRPGLYSFLMALSLLGCACVTLLLKKKEWYC